MTRFLKQCQGWLATLGTVALLAACGGSGSEPEEPAPPPPAAPIFTLQPADTQVTAGGEARFTANAQGTAVTWAWQRSTDGGITWTSVANASTAALTLPAVTLADNNTSLRAVASSGGLQAFSSAATLTVVAMVTAPAISVQLAPVQAMVGSSVTLAITATGTALQYQWQSSRDSTAWADVAGATAATLQLRGLALDANGTQYRVVVRNAAGSVTSSAVTLTVTAPALAPAFSLQPQDAAVTAPGTATFTVAVTGQPAPALQWQRSSNAGASYGDIVDATAASYTTPATSVVDSGTLYRVVASSSAGSATSTAARLTVATALAPPAFTAQPQDVSVLSGQTATWSTAASGVPVPSYQWQLSSDGGTTFANINGATGGSYSLVTVAADNGKRVRVLASNSEGTATSRAAVLEVTAPAGVLGRTWAPAQSLEENTSTRSVTLSDADIDDSGRVTVVFRKSDGTRDVVYATHGTPNGPGLLPTWTPPVAIDLLQGVAVSNMAGGIEMLSVKSAPGGNAVALWSHRAACTALTYQRPPGTCHYTYFARYNATTGQWTAPELLTDMFFGRYQILLNDRGDLVFYGDTWFSTPTTYYNEAKGLFMRAAGETGLRRQLLSDVPTTAFQKVEPHLDAAGNLLLVAEFRPAGVTTLLARRGTAATGLTQETVLESRNSRLEKSQVGLNGQQLVVWGLADGSPALYGATSSSATTPFASALAWDGRLGAESLTVADDGRAVLQGISVSGRVRWTPSEGWLPPENVAGPGLSFFSLGSNGAISRTGDVIQVNSNGASAVFDQATRTRHPAIGATQLEFVLGFQSSVVQSGSKVLLSSSGIGFVLMQNSCAVLPTPPATQCSGQVANTQPVTSLWSAFRK